jgi:hypothetical protein
MRLTRIAIFSAVVLIGAIACAADKIPEFIENMPIFGRTPPTEQWLWYTEAGPRDRIAPGTPLFALQEMAGWETEKMVRRYAQLGVGHLAAYAGNLKFHGTILAQLPPPQKQLKL